MNHPCIEEWRRSRRRRSRLRREGWYRRRRRPHNLRRREVNTRERYRMRTPRIKVGKAKCLVKSRAC